MTLTRLLVVLPVLALTAVVSSHAAKTCQVAEGSILVGLLLPDVSPGCAAILAAPSMSSVEVRTAGRRFSSSWSASTAGIVRHRHTTRLPETDVELTLTGFRAAAGADGAGPGGLPPAELTADEVFLSGPPGELPETVRIEGLRLRLDGRIVATVGHLAVSPPAILLDLSGEADLRVLLTHPLFDASRLPAGLQPVALRAEARPARHDGGISLLLTATSELIRLQLAVEVEQENATPPPGPGFLLDLLSVPQRGFEFRFVVPDRALAEVLVTAAEQRSGAGLGLLKDAVVRRLASPKGIAITWHGDPVPLRDLTPGDVIGAMLVGSDDSMMP